jgi:diacylglycerol kinase (ATP)
LSRFLKGFIYAGRGILLLIGTQRNARFHLFAAFFVILAGIWFDISRAEWLFILITIGFVFFAEAVNTAIEKIVDRLMPEKHPVAAKAKDLAAGGVLIAAITALIIGILIFGPRILELFRYL